MAQSGLLLDYLPTIDLLYYAVGVISRFPIGRGHHENLRWLAAKAAEAGAPGP